MLRCIFLSLCIAAIGGTILVSASKDVLGHITGDCPGQEVMITESLRIEQHVVNVTIPGCAGYRPNQNAIDPKESLFAKRSAYFHELDARADKVVTPAPAGNPAECLNPSICQCGITCAVTCATFNTDPSPTVADCRTLSALMRNFPVTIGPTFVLTKAFPDPILIDFSTCRSALGNLRTDGGNIEYCWDFFADNINSLINGCLAPGPNPGGACDAANGLWEMSIAGLFRG